VPRGPNQTALIRHAFPCLQLVCTDFLASLSPQCLGRCIRLLGCYGHQPCDVNVALTAIGLFWNFSDFLQTTRGAAVDSPAPAGDLTQHPLSTCDQLWLLLLHRLSILCVDQRPEVRNGASRTLYRTLDLHGHALNGTVWELIFWHILYPL
ncbi:hypothetical protein BJ085DRAFT_11431, partial [Dimargaris cristalligena]